MPVSTFRCTELPVLKNCICDISFITYENFGFSISFDFGESMSMCSKNCSISLASLLKRTTALFIPNSDESFAMINSPCP